MQIVLASIFNDRIIYEKSTWCCSLHNLIRLNKQKVVFCCKNCEWFILLQKTEWSYWNCSVFEIICTKNPTNSSIVEQINIKECFWRNVLSTRSVEMATFTYVEKKQNFIKDEDIITFNNKCKTLICIFINGVNIFQWRINR